MVKEILETPEEKVKKYPNLKTPWKKGQSGNPKGRLPKDRSVTMQIQKILSEKARRTLGKEVYTGTNAEILARRMIEKGIRHVEPRLVREILDRSDGKALSSLELIGKNGEPIKVIVQYDGDSKS